MQTSRRKQIFMHFLLFSMLALIFSGCSAAVSAPPANGKVNVIATFYPLYDFTKKIGGDYVQVTNLVPAGVEPHDWSPKSNDIRMMSKAQLFVYEGAGFEGWVDDFLKSLKDPAKLNTVEVSKGLQLIKATATGEGEWDPHAWLSPLTAKKMAENIKNGLVAADPIHTTAYETNYMLLSSQLDQLHNHYQEALAKTSQKEIVVSHQAFAYLCRDYGLTQKAIMGLSPDAEPTSKDLQEINAYIKANHIKYIFFEELVSDKLAKTLAQDAKVDTLVLNPLEGLSEKQLKAGEDYISIMEFNLQNLLKALQ